ncbi:hypothetical protein JCM10369A_26470 [Nocardioides pyridinolyticus]
MRNGVGEVGSGGGARGEGGEVHEARDQGGGQEGQRDGAVAGHDASTPDMGVRYEDPGEDRFR